MAGQVMSDESENTQAKRVIGIPFKPGNPGRPKGSRNKLQEDFLSDVLAAWETSGAEAISAMIADKPGDFVRMVAGLMPKEATLNINDNSELNDDELAARIRDIAAQLGPFLVGGTGDAETSTGHAAGAAVAPKLH